MDDEELLKAKELLKKNTGEILKGHGLELAAKNKLEKSLAVRSDSELSWKVLAEERLQMLNQIRDEMHAWNEAYLKEKERGDRLELHLFNLMNVTTPPLPTNEITAPGGQVNTRRSTFAQRRARYEATHKSNDSTDLRSDEV